MLLLTLKGSMGNNGLTLLEGGARNWTTTLAEEPECSILHIDTRTAIVQSFFSHKVLSM